MLWPYFLAGFMGRVEVRVSLYAGDSIVPQAGPDCLFIVYQCTRTHSPYPLPWPDRSFPDC
jgi:hypothetical protein